MFSLLELGGIHRHVSKSFTNSALVHRDVSIEKLESDSDDGCDTAHRSGQATNVHGLVSLSLSLSLSTRTHECIRTNAHTNSCSTFLCFVLAAAYLKYHCCDLSCLPFIWHFLFIVTHTHPHTHSHTCCCVLEVSSVSLVMLAIRLALFFHCVFCDTHTYTHARAHTHTRCTRARPHTHDACAHARTHTLAALFFALYVLLLT